MTKVEGIKTEWNAAPDAIKASAEWFFPYLERFVWGASSIANDYLIEGVDFLPDQIKQLSTQYPLRSEFLGCSTMTLENFDEFPGRSRGYSGLPEELRHQFARDVPLWSEFGRQECERFGFPYIDTFTDFPRRLAQAESILIANS